MINKRCNYCKALIPEAAVICKNCQTPQHWFRYFWHYIAGSAVPMVLVILAAIQLYFAARKQAQAKEALERVQETELRIDSTRKELRQITKVNLENSIFMEKSTLWNENLLPKGELRINKNLDELLFILEPDSTKHQAFKDSLQQYFKYPLTWD